MRVSVRSRGQTEPRQTVVLGGGPAGLLEALAAARRGRVLLLASRDANAHGSSLRVDTVPAPFLTLLLEFGIQPAQLDVHELHDSRVAAWDTSDIEVSRGPASAHIERPLLERALWDAVHATAAIEVCVGERWDEFPRANLVLDASGRRAVTAARVIAPAEKWKARIFWAEATNPVDAGAFRICALPDGYAYRVGSSRHMMLGIVGPEIGGAAWELEQRLRADGAGWLLDGLPALREMCAGLGGVASVQWSETGGTAMAVGDAALARDVLAAQGIAAGSADALRLAAGEIAPGLLWRERVDEQRRRHLSSLRSAIDRCRYRDRPVWVRYSQFLASAI